VTFSAVVRDINAMEMRRNEMVALALRVAMGAYFTWAGGEKIFVSGLDRFATDIANYKLVGESVAVAVAYILPWAEIVAGICFMLGMLRKGSWLAMLGFVTAFAFAVGSAWWRGMDIRCGCTGGAETITYWQKAAEFLLYYIALGFIAWSGWRGRAGKKTDAPG
ncbi:MAG: DoxX family membrane protein, partial [Akkermansiaceae bacterium]|nr:DoxX family membrane protein [Akkermansiaceae bacterium]